MDNQQIPPQYQPGVTPQMPQQPPQPPYQPPYQQPQQPGGSSDGKALAIVGLVLAILPITVLIGLIVSIVALTKSRKSGNISAKIISIIGIVLGTLGMIFSMMVAIVAFNTLMEKAQEDSSYSSTSDSSLQSSDQDQYPIDIADTKAELNGDKLSTPCFTAKMPKGYILSPKPSSCHTQISGDNGTGQYLILLSIIVRPQTGEISMEQLKSVYNSSSSAIESTEETTVNGLPALKINALQDDVFLVPTTHYIILDNSGKFTYKGKTITSFMISSPANRKTLSQTEEDIDIFVKSFEIK